jgi:N-sulfoglucosamine sulfohydrolase
MKKKYRFLSIIFIFSTFFLPLRVLSQHGKEKLNILFFTADDLERNSLGCYGSTVSDISPNIDRFADEGIRFNHAFVNASMCAPSRAIIATGLYGHNSGAPGFMKMPEDSKIPLLMEILRDNDYQTGILGKVSHSTPKTDFKWDYAFDQNQLGDGRSPTLYHEKAKDFFQACREKNKPFYFMVNSHDPHRPYHNPNSPNRPGAENPSRIYSPDEIEVPGYLPDLPEIREEISYYFNSVKRLDDTFGKVLLALEESGYKENTLVIFISDNGHAVPFAKANTYFASNLTPWLVRWPDIVKPGTVDNTHFISAIDFLPTILDALEIRPPENLNGTSHLAHYKGENQISGNFIYSQVDYKIGGGPVPMRSVQDGSFLYIFNAWSDGERVYRNNNEGMTMRAMEKEAINNVEIKKRVDLFRLRKPEELYCLQTDPDCLNDLMNNPPHKKQLHSMQSKLEEWMIKTNDPLLETYRKRYEPEEMLKAFYKSYPEAETSDKNKKRYSGR